jgi:hypothetical protein
MCPLRRIAPISSRPITWLLLTLIALAGCSGEEGSPALATNGPANTSAQAGSINSARVAAHSDQTAPTAGGPTEPSAAIPETADKALLAVLVGLHENRPGAVWDALPASYQQDVNDLVHLFAHRMHPEAWKWFVQIARKGAVVLRLPREIREEASVADAAGAEVRDKDTANTIEQMSGKERLAKMDHARLQHLMGREQNRTAPTPESPAEHQRREAVARLLDRIADTGPSGMDTLKAGDVGALLRRDEARTLLEALHAAVGAAMGIEGIQDLFALADDPAQVQLVLKESTADDAVVDINFPNDMRAEIECVRVDRKWIPRDLAEAWPATLSDLKQSVLEALPSETAAENFGPLFQYLGMVDSSLDAELAHARQDADGEPSPADIHRSALLDAPLMVLDYLIAGPYEPEPAETMTDADGILLDLPPRSEASSVDDETRAAVGAFEQLSGKSLTAEGKRVAVLCQAGAAVHTEHPTFAASVIEDLSRRFKAGKINVVEADKIVAWVAEHAGLTADSDLAALGTDLAADYIVRFHIEMLGFSEENFPELRRGRARGVVSVVEITADDDGRKVSKVIFRQPFESKHPQDAPISADAEEADAFRLRYLSRLHYELSRLFLREP